MHPPLSKKEEKLWVIAKEDAPGPTSYNQKDDPTAPRCVGRHKMGTEKRIAYTQNYAEQKKHIPAPGKYENID